MKKRNWSSWAFSLFVLLALTECHIRDHFFIVCLSVCVLSVCPLAMLSIPGILAGDSHAFLWTILFPQCFHESSVELRSKYWCKNLSGVKFSYEVQTLSRILCQIFFINIYQASVIYLTLVLLNDWTFTAVNLKMIIMLLIDKSFINPFPHKTIL